MFYPTREEVQDALDLLNSIAVTGKERLKAGQLRRELDDVAGIVFHVLPSDDVIAEHNDVLLSEMEAAADEAADASRVEE